MFWVLISLSVCLVLALLAALAAEVRRHLCTASRYWPLQLRPIVYRKSKDVILPPPTPEAAARGQIVRFVLDKHEIRPTYEGGRGLRVTSNRWLEPAK